MSATLQYEVYIMLAVECIGYVVFVDLYIQ